jgi:transposase-like protein
LFCWETELARRIAGAIAIPLYIAPTMVMPRRKFSKELKEAAVGKLRRGTPEREVARACGVDRWTLRRWQRELDEFGAGAFGGYGKNRRGRAEPRSQAVITYLSADEFEALKAACSAAGFRSLPEFARSCIFRTPDDPPVRRAKVILAELGAVAIRLKRALPLLAQSLERR